VVNQILNIKSFELKSQLSSVRRVMRQFLPASNFAGNIFIVGAQKAGTTALYSYLKKHPQIVGGDRKEIHFFDRVIEYEKGFARYRSYFPAFCSGRLSLDATPIYLYRKNCAKRLYQYAPDAKIIIILREPVARAFSAFNMYQQLIKRKELGKWLKSSNQDIRDFFLPLVDGRQSPEIDVFLNRELEILGANGNEEAPSLIRRGIYSPQIERYVSLFGREKVLIIFSDSLKMSPGATVAKLLDFIGLKPMRSGKYRLRHVRKYTADYSAKEKIAESADELFHKDRLELIVKYSLDVPW